MITSARILWTLSKYMYTNIGPDQNKMMFSTYETYSKKNAQSTDKRMKFSSESPTLTYTSVYGFFVFKMINDMRVEFNDLHSNCQS